MPYERYLLTAHWRAVRNLALQRAGYQCQRCRVTRELQVHHQTYERLGEELDTDVEVLCRGCHLGHHVVEVEISLGVYFKIVEDVLRGETFTMVADLIEAVKMRCAKLKIPYSGGQVQTVIARMKDERLAIAVPRKYAELTDKGTGSEPLTKAEAAGLALKYGGFAILKHMPDVQMRINRREHDSILLIRKLKAAAVDSARRCRELERIAAEAALADVDTAS